MNRQKLSKIVLALLVLSLLPAQARKIEGATAYGITERVSISSNGTQGDYGGSGLPSISADGRYIAFLSYATNLVDNDVNGYGDIFVRDRQTAETILVSRASDGTQGNSTSDMASISADGRYVTFRSSASNFVSGDPIGSWDIFVHDTQGGQTILASTTLDGRAGTGGDWPSISSDGRYVSFTTGLGAIVGGDTNNKSDVFVRDMQTGLTVRVSVASDGSQGNRQSFEPFISSDGRYIVFISEATNLVPGDTNNYTDVFVHDSQTGQTERVSVASDGTQGNANSFNPYISADGRYVVFGSYATTLVQGDFTGFTDADVFLHDRETNQTILVSIAPDGTQGNDDSRPSSLSPDGRFIVYTSIASNLVGGDTNGVSDVFVRDRTIGQSFRISVASGGSQGNNHSGNGSISADGRYVAFVSEATNLVSEDTNEVGDVFVQDRKGFLLNLPVAYTNFAQAAQGNIGENGPGKVNSWFDHQYPTYANPPNNSYPGLLRWDGRFFPNPTKIGEGWYDGHSGIDFQGAVGEQIFPAASGTVFGVVTSCQVGNLTCGSGYGNQLWINHQNGYATRYGHLSSVLVGNGASVARQTIGAIGTTGNSSGPHLHFGVYFDANNDGTWTENEVVDPYGWSGQNTDPWTPVSQYLWKYPIWLQQPVDMSGAVFTSLSGRTTVNIPSGALTITSTVELWDAPVPSSSGTFRSIGISFWLRVLEWLTGSIATSKTSQQTVDSFAQPVTLSVTIDPAVMTHLDESQLAIQWWSDTAGSWTPLATSVDQNTATAQTTQTGSFDLQAPLICSTDSREPDDDSSVAMTVATDGTMISDVFDVEPDKDWFKFDAQYGMTYIVETLDLANGVDTQLELYSTDAVTLLVSDDNSGGNRASKISWQAPSAGTYFIRVAQATGSSFGCTSDYQMRITREHLKIYLPIILR